MKTAKFRELQEHHEKTICCDSDTKYMQIARTERDQFTPFFCHDDGEFGGLLYEMQSSSIPSNFTYSKFSSSWKWKLVVVITVTFLCIRAHVLYKGKREKNHFWCSLLLFGAIATANGKWVLGREKKRLKKEEELEGPLTRRRIKFQVFVHLNFDNSSPV